VLQCAKTLVCPPLGGFLSFLSCIEASVQATSLNTKPNSYERNERNESSSYACNRKSLALRAGYTKETKEIAGSDAPRHGCEGRGERGS